MTRTARFTLVVAVVAALLLLGAGPGVRLGAWDFRTGFNLLRWGAYLGLAAALAALVQLAVPTLRPVRSGRLILALGLGAMDPVASPSYTLMHEYRGRLPLYHYDAWMEGRERAFLEGGGLEWIGGEGVAVIEWAERVKHLLPLPRIEVLLEHLDPTRRRLGFSVAGQCPRLEALLEELARRASRS